VPPVVSAATAVVHTQPSLGINVEKPMAYDDDVTQSTRAYRPSTVVDLPTQGTRHLALGPAGSAHNLREPIQLHTRTHSLRHQAEVTQI